MVEPLGRLLPLLLMAIVLGAQLAHGLAQLIALPLGGLEPVAQLLVLVRDPAEPLVLALGRFHPVPQALMLVQEVQQRGELGLAGPGPAPALGGGGPPL